MVDLTRFLAFRLTDENEKASALFSTALRRARSAMAGSRSTPTSETPGVRAAILDAAEGGVEFIVCITEGVPAHDEAWFYNKLRRDHPNVQLLGPNCPGIISPGKANIGITAGHIAEAGGPVGIVSRSGTLTYQALYELKAQKIGSAV